ncbi:nitroreductase family protein [Clostridium sp. HBUAS56017]|uniref:nitroreductase family protein n=1 Tax=Clostridium sp. HBUAS56017 TaxID=2571128 RepID=UPI001177ABA3|nr:nitroreductase family protein [Clostridium sp. HBUAS56017]
MEIDNKWFDAISIRTSRRKYEFKDIEVEKIDKIQSLIEKVNKESGLKFKFVEDASKVLNGFKASYGMLSGAKSLIALAGDANMRDLQRNIGYYGELVVLECTSLGLGTCWVGGTYNKEACRRSINLQDNEELLCIIAVGYVNEEKSFKEKLVAKINKKTQNFDEVLVEKDGEIPSWVKSGIEASMLAPSAMNKRPIAFIYTQGKIKAFACRKNHNVEDIDLGISMAHFEIGAFKEGYKGEWQVVNGENVFS